MIGTIGSPVLIKKEPYFSIKNVALFKPYDKKFSQYLLCYLHSDFFKREISDSLNGSNQSFISLNSFRNMLIVLPREEEQNAIATALSDTDALIDSLEKLIAKKQAIKQGAMQELLTGKRRLKGFSGEWKVKKIGECAEILQGGTPNTFNSIYWNGDIIWVTPSDISKLKQLFIDSSEKTISIEGLNNSSAKLLPKGTILLCTRATIGYLAIADKPMATNQGFKNLVCNSSVDNIFMAYLLSTKRQEMEANAIGSTFLEISKTVLSNMEVCIPSINEQQAIAQILTDMDDEISALQKKLDKVRRIKQGMMAELLTGRIRLI